MLQGSLPDVFLDTDVAFDIISKREPHFETSSTLLHLAIEGIVRLVISEISLANLFYLSFDIHKIKDAQTRLSDFIGACEVVFSGKESILQALHSPFRDKEDALQYYTAIRARADYFVTRNKKDYRHKISSLPVYTPVEFSKLTSRS